MENIKIGIIGTGFSAKAHIEALRRLNYIEVVAISGSSLEKSRLAAEQFGIPAYYGTADELISAEEVDVVHNCTPNHLHFSINKKILEKGKHVISEKPLAMTSKESKELVELALSKNVLAGVCFNYRHFPLVNEVKEMIKNNKYGPVYFVHGTYLQDWLLYDTDYNWRLNPDKNGKSRAIADIGSHWCDTIQYVLGKKVVEVFADLKTVHPVRKRPVGEVETFKNNGEGDVHVEIDITTEDCGSVLIHFEDGTKGVFVVSQVNAGRKNHLSFDIAAQSGSLAWNQENPNRLWIGRRERANEELVKDPSLLSLSSANLAHYPGGHQEGWPDGLKNLFIDFYQQVEQFPSLSESSFASFAEGHNIMQLIDAILVSHEEKRWVKVQKEQGVVQ
jgi:predicted dehydrogenase